MMRDSEDTGIKSEYLAGMLRNLHSGGKALGPV
jgi:hypothetical protein